MCNFDRLAAVKARYDPSNLFRVNRNIAPGQTPAAVGNALWGALIK